MRCNVATAWGCRISCARICATSATRSCRSEEHTSELQSQSNLVCRLLLENKTMIPLLLSKLPPLREALQPLRRIYQYADTRHNALGSVSVLEAAIASIHIVKRIQTVQ